MMRSLVCFTSIGVMAVAMAATAQEPPKAEITKATYMVKGLH